MSEQRHREMIVCSPSIAEPPKQIREPTEFGSSSTANGEAGVAKLAMQVAGKLNKVAKIAATVNKTVENIGARRLHTVLERIVEEISFDAPDQSGDKLIVDAKMVKERLDDMMIQSDLSKFVL